MQKCFKILILSLICLSILSSTFAFSVSAAEYDLGNPVVWSFNSNDGGFYENYSYSFYEYPDGVYTGSNDVSWRIWYYPDGYSSSGTYDPDFSFSVGVNSRGIINIFNYNDLGYKVRASNLDTSKNVLAFSAKYPVRERLYMPAIAYKGIYFPEANQIIKVEFSIDTLKLGTSSDIPSFYNSLLVPSNLCWFELENIPSSQTNKYDKIPFSSVVVTPSSNGRVLHYTYYFNALGSEFQSALNNSEGSLLQLVIRFPFYFGNSSLLDEGVFCLTNAVLPSSYSILTPGGYSQELESIENAIISSNEQMIDYFDTISSTDQAVIIHQKQQNDKFDDAMDDFNKSDSVIKDIASSVIDPDVQSSSSQALSSIDLTGIKSVFSNPFIISLFTLSLGFGFLRLILYGTKEG